MADFKLAVKIVRILAAWLLALAAAAGLGAARAGRPVFDPVPRPEIEARLRAAPLKNADREAAIEQLFRRSGCPEVTTQPLGPESRALPNVICTLPGATPSVIMVSAHFDHVRKGAGVIDNWSGASMLPDLLDSLRHEPRRHTFVFIGFSEEEKGLVGSKYYVKHLTAEQVDKIRAEVNIDTLALGPTKIWLRHSDRQLTVELYAVARAKHLPLSDFDPGDAEDDSEPFIRRNIPTLMIHSVTNETWHVLHSADDNIRAVNFADYYDTYLLLADYLATIDAKLTDRPR